jgi:hypothetical protein
MKSISEVTTWYRGQYRGADKSLAQPTSRRILFDASLVIYINNVNIPPIMIIHCHRVITQLQLINIIIIIISRIHETQNHLSL